MNIKDLKNYIEDKIEEYSETYYNILENIPSCVIEQREDLCNRVHDYYIILGVYKEILGLFEGDKDEEN